jgi:toxin ParE1/3/4
MAKLDYKVIWAEGARLDFKEILEFIAEDNPDASIRVGEKIIERINQLKSFPEMGSKIPEGPEVDARQLVEGNYRIIYQVNEAERFVDIIRIWHGARGEVKL